MAKIFKRSLTVGLCLIFFLALYPVKLAQYLYAKLVIRETVAYIGFSEVFAETFYTVEEALKVLLPGAQNIREETKILGAEQKSSIAKLAEIQFDPELDKEYHFYIGQSNGETIGYAINDTVKGKWGPIHYMLALEPDGKIKDALVLELKERRGRPVKERRFLGQFMNKSIADPIKLNKDIKGVAGATISSRGMTTGIKKMIYVFNALYKK